MVVAVDKMTRQAGLPEEFPLSQNFPAHEFARISGETDADPGPGGRGAPGPPFQSRGKRIVEMQMPAGLEMGVGASHGDSFLRAWLGHHESGGMQAARNISMQNGFVDSGVHPKIIRHEDNLFFHALFLA